LGIQPRKKGGFFTCKKSWYNSTWNSYTNKFSFLKYTLVKKNGSFPDFAAGNDFKKNKWKLLFLIMKKQQNFILNLGYHLLQIRII